MAMREYLAVSQSGEQRTIYAPDERTAIQLLRWTEPQEKWTQIREILPSRAELIVRLVSPDYPDVSTEAYEHYKNLALRLSLCVMQPGSYEKRFVRDMVAILYLGKPISSKQMGYLDDLQFKYRVQLSNLDQEGDGR